MKIEFQSQIRSHILTFSYVNFINLRRTNWNLTFSSELPEGQAARIASTFIDNFPRIPWPQHVKNISDVGREKWVIVVNVLKASGTPEFKVTHFGETSSDNIPQDVLRCFEQELILFKKCVERLEKEKKQTL
jgi:hypothetical protein